MRLRTANLLGALAREVVDRLDRRMDLARNQTDSALAALNIVGFYEGCSNNALARALKLSHSATVRLVDKLESLGLVEVRAADDGRAVALYLTHSGRERVAGALQARCAALSDVIDLLSPDEQVQLTGLLETLLRGLTTSAAEADHICRLCDGQLCPEDCCPVHQAAALKAA